MKLISLISNLLAAFLILIGTVAAYAEPAAPGSHAVPGKSEIPSASDAPRTIQSVRQLAFAHQDARVLVRGVVVEAPGRLPADSRFFRIQDGTAGIAALPPTRVNLNLGDCVDVAGRTMLFNDLEPQVETSAITPAAGQCAAPEVHVYSVSDVRAGRGSGGLVQVQGRVVDSSAGDDRALILVGEASSPLRVILRRPGAALGEIRQKAGEGALIEVVGVSIPSADGKSHFLRLREPADIVAKEPPVLRPHPQVLRLSVLLVLVVAATFGWIIALRRAVARKTSEIGQLLEQAQAASVLKGQFLANMSHEIRTPIHGIMGMQEMVLQSDLQPLQRESLEIAHSATRSLLSLLNDILDLSKIEANSMRITLEPMSLPALMTEMERQFHARARVSGVAFEVKLDPDVPTYILGDALRLRQVLTNLLSNAFKFTQQGSVTMRCSVAGRSEPDAPTNLVRIRFAVQDTGIGIAPADLEKVFSAFHQADGSITRRFGGTGLGLTIASHLVELMHGKLKCDSTEGKGSLFSFEAEFEVSETPEAARAQSGEVAPHSALCILLAEDNPINQLVVRRPLEALGHEVVVCEDGRRAAELCAERQFDIVLMDVQMPVLDGLESARRIREEEMNSRSPRVPILALTANSLREQIDACIEAGMDDFLCKPFLPADLLNLISVHMQQRITSPSPAPHRT